MREAFLGDWADGGGPVCLLALADWCDDQGLDDEAACWRWCAGEGVGPMRSVLPGLWVWMPHQTGFTKQYFDLEANLYWQLRGYDGTHSNSVVRRYGSQAAAMLALRGAWLRTPAAERPSVREGVA